MMPGNHQTSNGLVTKSCRGKFVFGQCGGLAYYPETFAVSCQGNLPGELSEFSCSLQAEHIRLQV